MLFGVVLTLVLAVTAQDNNETVQYYTNLITESYRTGQTYQQPTNAYRYYSNTSIKSFGSYDFVIIGAGSGGTVVTNRLSEVSKWKVLLLEAGGHGNNLTDIPSSYTPIEFTNYNWGFNTTSQDDACLGMVNRRCTSPRGLGLGGTSLINGLVYARGYEWDFDTWAKMVGNARWNYKNALAYMKKSENFVHNDPEAPYDPAYHGKGGPLQVEFHEPRSPLLANYFRANEELGYKIVDYNANQLGTGPSQMNTIKGRRDDGGKAFIDPIRNRQNLEILTYSYVTKLRIKNGRATGVEFTYQGQNYFVEATKEVILCAGAISSPQILMLSGIGPERHLRKLGIKVVKDLPVGNNLRDNSAFYGLTFSTNYTEPDLSLEEQVEMFLNGRGPLTKIGAEGIGFYESRRTRNTGIPEIELEFVPPRTKNALSQRFFSLTDQTYADIWQYNNNSNTFRVNVMVSHARSSGTVRLKSNNPFDYHLINPRYLSDPGQVDINTMYDGVQLVLRLAQTKAFQAVNATFQSGPIRACRKYKYFSKKYWFCAIRQVTANLYHPSGTCSMGVDPRTAVVDSELRVFGIRGLRVADTSVIPLSLAGHTHAATVMVGEQLGDLVKATYKNEI